MKFPFTNNKISTAFGNCCRLNEGDVVSETAEEKEQREKNLRELFATLEEEAEERKREKEQRIKDEEELKEAMKIFDADDWREFDVGYTRRYYDIDSEGMRVGDEKTEFVDMSKPRECSYSSETDRDGIVKKTTILKLSTSPTNSSKPAVAYSGITLRQLRAVWANIVRRCVAEGWRNNDGIILTPDKVTLLEVNKYIITPFSCGKQTSFVQALPSTAGPQLPRFFVSYIWSDTPTVKGFIQCLEEARHDLRVNCDDDHDRRGGGMTADTPVFICAYVNNPWDAPPSSELTCGIETLLGQRMRNSGGVP